MLRSHPEEWILPKGGWEEGETAEEAAEREVLMYWLLSGNE